jgi:hypothetical protein
MSVEGPVASRLASGVGHARGLYPRHEYEWRFAIDQPNSGPHRDARGA